MNKRTNRIRAVSRLAIVGLLGTLTAAAAGPAVAAADDAPASSSRDEVSALAWPHRYQNWSQVPGNYAGVVFRPYGDRFQTWEHRDGRRSTICWHYKDVADDWKSIGLHDGAVHEYNLNLREDRRIYFIVQTDGRQSPSYVSEYRTSGR
jgi:hypothetical protein